MGRPNKKNKRRRSGRCSVCFQRVKGHIGRPGPTCQNIPSNFNRNSDTEDETPVMATNVNTNKDPVPDPPIEQVFDANEQCKINKTLQETLMVLCSQMKDLTDEVLTLKAAKDVHEVPPPTSNNSKGSSIPPRPAPRNLPPVHSGGPNGGARPKEPPRAPIEIQDDQEDSNWGDHPILEVPTPLRAAISKSPEGTTGHSGTSIQYYLGSSGGSTKDSTPAPTSANIDLLRPIGSSIQLDKEVTVPGMPDKCILSALNGEYILLDWFLTNFSPDVNVEGFIDNSERSKRKRRYIYNFLSWNEAWTNYERLMVSYHGLELYKIMSKYRTKIQDLEKRHYWSAVSKFDVHHRTFLSGFSVKFTPLNSEMITEHLGPSTLRPNAQRCDYIPNLIAINIFNISKPDLI